MSFLKVTAALGLVLIFSSYVSPLDFSVMNFARSTLMKYSGGTQRTVNVLKPELKVVKSRGKKTLFKKKKTTGWGGGGRRRRSSRFRVRKKTTTTKLKFVPQTKTYRTRTSPSNKFLEALTAVERGVADAKAAQRYLRYSSKKLQALKNTIKLAAGQRLFQFSRHRLGEAFFLIRNHAAKSSRPKRSTSTPASTFMNDLKLSMGATKFDEFMAVMGDVTLMFAIDTTGSMSNDIDAAKRIAVDVINYPRQNPVSYILSPFNDPSTGPVIFKESSKGAEFVKAINNLKADRGGDCPELTFKGILDALYEGPDWGSPLYVFTDASAKDNTASNMEEIKSMAKYLGTTINFFTTGHCSGSPTNPFKEIADATSGQLLSLSGHFELRKLTGFTGSVLGGSNIISVGSNNSYRKKRAAGDSRYTITIDDSVDKMSVCITMERPNQGTSISLTDPKGATITSGKLSLTKVSVYDITRPNVGTWTLVVPAPAGKHDYFVKSSSDTNIDFEYYFLFEIRRPRSEVPISDPLIGQQTKLVLTIAGYKKVQKNTVVLELITRYGRHIKNVALTPDSQGMRYVASFTPPSRPFKLKIKGTTKAGNPFERISRNIVEPKHILMRVLHSNKDFTLIRGQKTSVTIHLYNAAPVRKVVNIDVKDRLGYARMSSSHRRRVLRPRRPAFFPIEFQTPSNAKIGAGDTAVVSLSVLKGSERSSMPVQLIVIA